MNEQAKAWVDYRVDDLRRYIKPLDSKGCVQNPDFDKALHAAAINALVNLREMMDGPAPVGYSKAEHAYLHDADMQRLRLTTAKMQRDSMRDTLKKCFAAPPRTKTPPPPRRIIHNSHEITKPHRLV